MISNRWASKGAFWAATSTILLVISLCAAASAQTGRPPGTGDGFGGVLEHPVEPRATLPAFEQATPTPGFVLPPVPTPSEEEAGKLPGVLRAYVKEYRITGNTVFSAAELAEITKPYSNRTVTYEDLEAVRYALTVHYVQHGYVNSGAVIPDQAIRDGVVEMQIIEGRLTAIEVDGNRWVRARYIRERLTRFTGPPLNIQTLQQGLQLLQANPLIRRINAELRPGLARGEAILTVRLEDEVPYSLGLAYNNYQSPSVGSERGVLTLADRSVTGNDDSLLFTFAVTGGVNDYDAIYTLPVTPRDTTVAFEFRRTDTSVIESPFDRLDITSTTDSYDLTLRHPLYRTLTEELAPAFTFEYRRSDTFLLGQPFSFSPGAQNGKSRITSLNFAPEWVRRSPTQVVAARWRFSLGIDALGATSNSGPVPDGQYFLWLGQFQWARRLPWFDLETITRADVQLTHDPLLSLEQFALGGAQSVRGYRENELVRDNGAVGSVEVRVPVLHDRRGEPMVQLAPFSDVGSGWSARGPTPDPKYLASVGIGLRWAITETIGFQIYWGEKLKNVTTPGGDLQDAGIHLQLSSEFGLPQALAGGLPQFRETRRVGNP